MSLAHPQSHPPRRRCFVRLAFACVVTLSALPALAARLALVIGNAAYADSPLKNPVNDARAVDKALTGLGFTVTRVENLERDDIGLTIEGFATRIRPGDDVVVFYAGHGLQSKGVNYFPAVDARIRVESDIPLNSINLNHLLDRLDGARAAVKLVLLDACRNNPYARRFRSSARGLARVEVAPSGTLMHFATRPGSIAADGDGRNGLYTSHLLRHIATPGITVESMFKRVASDVRQASRGEQEPWVEGSLQGEFFFASGGTPVLDPLANVQVEPSGGGVDFGDLERARRERESVRASWTAWQSRMEADFEKAKGFSDPKLSAAAWERFLEAYPQDNPFSGEDERLRSEARERMAQAQLGWSGAMPAGKTFKDCGDCPEMVVIPSGSFEMGSNDGYAEEKPVHRVTISRSFALGKYEVTQGEWHALMGSNPSAFLSCGDNCPVERVSWEDAQEFIRRLNAKTGEHYRLPSEAEWEYACRAGGRHQYCGSDTIDSVAWYLRNSGSTTHRAGTKSANGFGLYDMSGNVYEWVQDCYNDSYAGAPSDGSAWESGDCRRRVLRGGSWDHSPPRSLSAFRGRFLAALRLYTFGLRLARTLR